MHVPPPDLLFALLAVQLGFVDRARFAQALQESRDAEGRSLAEALVKGGALTPEQRDHVRRLVDSQLAEHGGDLASTLATMAAGGQLDESLASVSATATSVAARHDDAARSLATVSPVPNSRRVEESDRLSTVVGAVPVSDTETLLAPGRLKRPPTTNFISQHRVLFPRRAPYQSEPPKCGPPMARGKQGDIRF